MPTAAAPGRRKGSILDEGRKVTVRRPGVRRKKDGSSEELRLATYDAAREVLEELRAFVAAKNAQALASLEEAGLELIALHLLEVSNTLHRNLLSTSIIENSIRNVRATIGRVTRWREETDQAARWMGLAVTRAEKGFRKLAGYRELPQLAEALRRPSKDAADAA